MAHKTFWSRAQEEMDTPRKITTLEIHVAYNPDVTTPEEIAKRIDGILDFEDSNSAFEHLGWPTLGEVTVNDNFMD